MDANVCISAVLNAKSIPATILDHALGDGPYDFVLCAPSQLFSKVQEGLVRPKIAGRLQWSPEETALYVRRLRLAVEEVPTADIAEIPQYTADPEDDPYVHAGVLARASYLISGDDNVLRMKEPPVAGSNPAGRALKCLRTQETRRPGTRAGPR